MSTAVITDLTEASFEAEIESHRGAAAVDMWAEWCGPCRVLAPALEALATELRGRVKIAKLDVDAHPVIAERYAVRAIPTLLLFRDGTLVDRVVGVVPRRELAAKLAALGARAEDPAA